MSYLYLAERPGDESGDRNPHRLLRGIVMRVLEKENVCATQEDYSRTVNSLVDALLDGRLTQSQECDCDEVGRVECRQHGQRE